MNYFDSLGPRTNWMPPWGGGNMPDTPWGGGGRRGGGMWGNRGMPPPGGIGGGRWGGGRPGMPGIPWGGRTNWPGVEGPSGLASLAEGRPGASENADAYWRNLGAFSANPPMFGTNMPLAPWVGGVSMGAQDPAGVPNPMGPEWSRPGIGEPGGLRGGGSRMPPSSGSGGGWLGGGGSSGGGGSGTNMPGIPWGGPTNWMPPGLGGGMSSPGGVGMGGGGGGSGPGPGGGGGGGTNRPLPWGAGKWSGGYRPWPGGGGGV